MRIGIFGGTFDPVHLGHLILAEQCREQGELDEVWFIPAARPPHKSDQDLTPFARRVEMLQLAIAGHPGFRIDELEKDRPGPSYTYLTLEELRARHPDDEFFLLIGSDSLVDLVHWREPTRILDLATLLIFERPGIPVASLDQLRVVLNLPAGASLKAKTVTGPLVSISSTDLRRRAAVGRSIRYQIPRAVECYLQTHRLYQ